MEYIQFVENLVPGDAISSNVLELHRLFKKYNFDSTIVLSYADPEYKGVGQNISSLINTDLSNSIGIYHFSIHSKNYHLFQQLNFKIKVLVFHNVTPPSFFPVKDKYRIESIEPSMKDLLSFHNSFDFAIADSDYNSNILKINGFKKEIYIVPPFTHLQQKFGNVKRVQYNPGQILFVSQINYHKRQDDVIKAFKYYRNLFNNAATLYLVGSNYLGSPMSNRIRNLSAGDKSIILTGKISNQELAQLYTSSSIYLSLSEHEGFGVPLVEAMYFSLPVIAYQAGAVSETLGSGGIIFSSKNFNLLASTIHELDTNQQLRKYIKNNQKTELQRYQPELIERKLVKCLIKNIK